MSNVGNIDRMARVFLGFAALGVGYYYGSYWGLVGLIPLGTGLLGACPAYSIFGVSSCKRR